MKGKSKQLMWEKLQAKGFWHHVIIFGSLGWGLMMLVAMGLINDVFIDGYLNSRVLVHSITWLVGGAFFGTLNWYMTRYSAYRESRKSA